jgi:hypothetical protein
MSGAIPPLPQYAFMAWCSVKTQGQLDLFLLFALQTQGYLTPHSEEKMAASVFFFLK